MVPGKAIDGFHCSVSEVSCYFTVITMYDIKDHTIPGKSYLCVSLQRFGGLFLFLTVIMTLRIILFLLCSIPNYFSGGPNFETVLILEKRVDLCCGITKRYVSITGPSFMKSFLKTVLFM